VRRESAVDVFRGNGSEDRAATECPAAICVAEFHPSAPPRATVVVAMAAVPWPEPRAAFGANPLDFG